MHENISTSQQWLAIDLLVEHLEEGSPVLAAVVFNRLVKSHGLSPIPLEASIKRFVFDRHGPAVEKHMAHLAVGRSMLASSRKGRFI